MKDTYGRAIDYMRISITDRCNLRCRYCMPNDIDLVPMTDILSYEQIELITKAAASVGIKKIKLTGGEPLIRRGCANLVGNLKKIPGIEQVTITTNGVLLKRLLPELVANGLDAVNVSLDTLNRDKFVDITMKDRFQDVMDGIEAALEAGLPVKVNAVLQRGMNDDEWLDLLRMSMDRPLDVRFIEMMPIGFGQEFQPVYNDELLEKLLEIYPDLEKDTRIHGNGPAVYYKLPGAKGSIGFISAMHGKFCGECNRIRLTSLGKLKPCLCFGDMVDLMPILHQETMEDGDAVVAGATSTIAAGAASSVEARVTSAVETGAADAYELEPDEIETFYHLKTAIRKCISMKPQNHKFENFAEVTEAKRMIEIGG